MADEKFEDIKLRQTKIRLPIKARTNIKHGGTNKYYVKIGEIVPDKKKWGLTKIKNNAKHFIKKFIKKFNGHPENRGIEPRFQINLDYDGMGWRGGKIFNSVDDYNVFEPDNYDEHYQQDYNQKFFKRAQVVIYFYDKEGGISKLNDCLYECLQDSIINLKRHINSPKLLKERLNIPRNAGINIERMEEIDNMLPPSVGFNVSGDFSYISKKKTGTKIEIILNNGHYSLVKDDIISNIVCEDRPIIIYEDVKDRMKIYDGENITYCSLSQFFQLKKNNHIFKSHDYDIKKSYNDILLWRNEMFELSNGEIDIKKTGDAVQTALYLFNKYTQYNKNPESLTINEIEWLDKSTKGSIQLYHEYEGEAHEYDINSFYQNLLIHNNYPVKKGEFKQLDNLDNLEYGIYKCKINIPQENTKWFRINDFKLYTHKDISTAQLLGGTVELVQGEINALVYNTDSLCRGDYLFKGFVEMMYDLKVKSKELKLSSVPFIKQILTCLWGKLSSTKKTAMRVDIDGEDDFEIYENSKIKYCVPYGDNGLYKVCLIPLKHNAYNYYRIKPFITSIGRHVCYHTFYKYKDKIVRLHTDGATLTEQVDIKLGDGIGCMKYEGCCNIAIKKLNDFTKF